MGLFDFIKKKATQNKADNPPATKSDIKFKMVFTETINGKTNQVNTEKIETDEELFPTDLEHLTKDGELPWGWHTHTKDFTERIGGEYSIFWKMWLDTKSKSPEEHYPALKSFVLFLEDAGKLCESKGECYEFWFYEILATKDFIAKRKSELKELTSNFDVLQKEYEIKVWEREELQRKTIEMKDDVILLLKENDGILQSDFWKLFDDEICRAAAQDIVYALRREGKIERTKSGRSFVLHYRE